MSLEYRIDHRGVVELQAPGKKCRCCLYLWLLLLVLLGGLAWFFLNNALLVGEVGSGSWPAVSFSSRASEQHLLEKQKSELIRLEGQAKAAQRAQQIQEVANEELRRKLLLLEGDLVEAKQRLLLYEAILTPREDAPRGLQIQHFGLKVRQLDDEGHTLEAGRFYQYHLVLAHLRGGEAVVSGHFDIRLTGKLNGKDKAFALAELTRAREDEQTERFSLKYYLSLEGTLELPEFFIPEKITVILQPDKNSGAEKITKTYDWNSFKLSQKSIAS